MTRIAGLPMYDFLEIRSATDQFWSALHQALSMRGLNDVPLALTRPHDLPAFWRDRSLLIGQTCGYPMMIGVCGAGRYVATPCSSTPRSHGAYHKSVIIAHRNARISTLSDSRGSVCAINMGDSNTGMNLLRLEIAKLKLGSPFFARVFETLAHRKSMHAVATGEADLAAIDCVSYAHIEKIDPALAGELAIIGETEATPALPFITSPDTGDETLVALREALQAVIGDRQYRPIMQTLMLDGVEVLPAGAYDRIREIENQAITLGYPALN